MYSTIFDIRSGQAYSIFSTFGKKLIKKYVKNFVQKGGGLVRRKYTVSVPVVKGEVFINQRECTSTYTKRAKNRTNDVCYPQKLKGDLLLQHQEK